jgi:hypothetical protein
MYTWILQVVIYSKGDSVGNPLLVLLNKFSLSLPLLRININ